MRRPLYGCWQRRRDCQLTIRECVLRLGRPERTSLLVFLRKPERSGGSATNSVRRFDCQIFSFVLVNPQVQAPTSKVFAALDLATEP